MKTHNKRFGILAIFLLLWSLIAPALALASAPQGSDVSGHWAESQLKRWVSQGWLTGYGDGSVRPDQPVTRAEFVAFLMSWFSHPAHN